MKPILYPESETAFDTNGIGVLADAISCVPDTVLNGQYEITLKYPITGIHFKEIAQRSIILAKSEPDKDPQPFRVYHITKPTITGIVTVYARHLCYDLIGTPVSPFTAASASDALAKMQANAATDCPFSFFTDKSTAATMTVAVPTSAWTLLGGSEGSILDTYGGEYEFDRWTVNLLNRRGADRGVSIRYGKNLTSLVQDENCANCYTGVYPYWENIDGTELVQLPEKILDAPGTYSYVRVLTLDLSEEWTEAPTEDQLRSKAQAYMTANSIGVPTVSWKIEFVQLEQTEEYKHLGKLEQVLLGDTVSVIFADMGINASARVVEVEYDSLLERYKSVTLGSVKANLATTIATQHKEISKKPSVSITEKIATSLAKAMTGALGGCARFIDTNGDGMPDELYIADNADPDKAQKVWRGNYEGWAVSKTGYNGPFIMGATVEEGIMAWMVTAANLIAGTIKSADDGKTFFVDLDNGILRGNFSEFSVKGKTVDELVTVGGTNLLLNSEPSSLVSPWFGFNSTSISVATVDDRQCIKCVASTGSLSNSYACQTVTTVQSDEYTLSANVYTTAVQTVLLAVWRITDSGWVNIRRMEFDCAAGWNKLQMTISGAAAESKLVAGFGTANTDAPIYIYHPKFEAGNTATDWNPAPADLKSYADGAVDAQTQEDIFNKLTNDGEIQGLFMKDGQLYINASYLASGVIASADGTVKVDLLNNKVTIATLEEDVKGKIELSASGISGYGWDETSESYYRTLKITPGGKSSQGTESLTSITSGSSTAGISIVAGTRDAVLMLGNSLGQVRLVGATIQINGKTVSWKDNSDGTCTLIGT